MRRPLSMRPVDTFYAVYLFLHLWPALLFDSQAFLPAQAVPKALRDALGSWLQVSNDPLIGQARAQSMVWFRTFLSCEILLQAPFFILGPILLYRDDKRVQIMLLIYAAHSATTTLPCLTTLLYSPLISQKQLVILLASYLPYFVVPVIMIFDMYRRLSRALLASEGKQKVS